MKSRDDKPPRAWNSTIARRTKGIERTPLAGPVGPTRKPKPRKPIAKRNPEREAKRRKQYAAKLAKYRASETYRVVARRADGQCEWSELLKGEWVPNPLPYRCLVTEGLEHHHKTYARFGGDELPKDILVVCQFHHAMVEAQKPAGNRRSRSPRT